MSDAPTPAPSEPAPKERRSFQMPHIYVILFCFTALATLLTYVVPAGEYKRIPGPEGRESIDPDSYTQVAADPVGLVDFMMAIPNGLIAASDVVFFTFIIGGMFMVLRATGIIEAAVDRLTRRFERRSILVIPALMLTFAVIASLIGTQELALVYVPVILPLIIALGFDSMTAAAVALCATTAGFTAGFLNPINTGLGQKIAGVPVFSGLALRAVIFVALIAVGIAYVMRYAARVRAEPSRSLMVGDEDEQQKITQYRHGEAVEPAPVSPRQKWAGLATLALFGVLVWGVLVQDWFMVEMSGMFIIIGIVAGVVAGLSATQICESFNEGLRQVLVGAMIVGVARAVAVVLEDGQVMDTMVQGLGNAVGALPASMAALGMFFSQLGFNFVVPSGSGQALVTMPIMAPLADLLDITRQTSVLAYQLGDGLGNIIYPTSGYFMATIALAGVRWDKWVRFFLPLFITWVTMCAGFVVLAQAIGWNG